MPEKEEVICAGCGQAIKSKDTRGWHEGEIYHVRCLPKVQGGPAKQRSFGDGPMPI